MMLCSPGRKVHKDHLQQIVLTGVGDDDDVGCGK